jgi:hypothetical protein
MNTKSSQNLADLYRTNPRQACRLALRRTAHWTDKDNRLQAISELLDLHGVEAIKGEWQNGYWCDIVACYCNTGDTYALTVIQVRGEQSWHRSRFIISSWGDWVEANQEKYAIQ